ncbi:MAG: hypothetical protein BroJett011_45980 [Chloroflexota bacterium]|nr:MAG: hypothetical protein BroJett011_45980 [Chloroflexota bacterium]
MIELKSFFSRATRRLLRRPAKTAIPASEVSFIPYIPTNTDESKLLSDISLFFGLKETEVTAEFRDYSAFHVAQDYAQRLGERKYLCFEEAFILYVIMKITQPRTVVEIGTQYGKSTRRIIDMINKLELNTRIICFDIVDQVQYFTPEEADLVLKDVTYTFQHDILETYAPDLIYLDAHPYNLLKNVIFDLVSTSNNCTLAIHDCSTGLCNPNMTLSKDDPNVTSRTGVWERHVLAEIFGVKDVKSKQLDDIEMATHRLKIFDTLHGLAIISPKTWSQFEGGLG